MEGGDDDDDGPVMTKEEFKAVVNSLRKADDAVKKNTAEMKPTRRVLKESREDAADYMQDHDIQECSMRGGEEKLVLTVRHVKIKPKKPDSLRRLTELLGGNVERAIEFYDGIFENLETKEVASVTRKKVPARARRESEEK